MTLLDDDFTWIFCVITCDLTPDDVVNDDDDEVDAGGDDICGAALEATVEVDECKTTFGLTFWMFGSWVVTAAATAGVGWEFKSVRA